MARARHQSNQADGGVACWVYSLKTSLSCCQVLVCFSTRGRPGSGHRLWLEPLLGGQDTTRERKAGDGSNISTCCKFIFSPLSLEGLFITGSSWRPQMSMCSLTNCWVSTHEVAQAARTWGQGLEESQPHHRRHSTMRTTKSSRGPRGFPVAFGCAELVC